MRRRLQHLFLALPVVFASAAFVDGRDAFACGGCLVGQSESTQVTGHRMILSVSQDKTTLWDQITYAGDPSSFAWVLPIKGQVDIGLSSDALFEALEGQTTVTINSPPVSCPVGCFGGGSGGGGGGGPGGGPMNGDVTVIAQEVVGPYETVQLSSADSQALKTWLTNNNYAIPADISGVIDAYVAEGFDFLALKLVPGQGVDSMRPVRVTSPGAGPTLPLRMVAAGTGAVTSINLWVFGEGRYEPSNFPSFEIDPNKLVWNWDTSSSNYKELRDAGFAATEGKAWLVEVAEPAWAGNLEWPLQSLVDFDPLNSGYGDAQGMGAKEELAEDLDALYGAFVQNQSMWITRLHAELPRAALANDLKIGASLNQLPVYRSLQAWQSVGTPPPCPPVQECEPPPPPDEEGNNSWSGFWEPGSAQAGGGGGCAMGGGVGASAILGGLALSVSALVARRRRSRGGR